MLPLASWRGDPAANRYGYRYAMGMVEVVTTGEARSALHRIAARFDAGDGEPV